MSHSSVEEDVRGVRNDSIDNSNVSAPIEAVASRIKEMRDILDISVETMAQKLDITVEQYLEYENCEKDIPIGVIYKAANVMGIDSTLLLIGESARMQSYTVVRKGGGVEIERYRGYSFTSLAMNYIGRTMDPMIVTIHNDEQPAKPVKHGGQEFNYVLEGKIIVTVNGNDFLLEEGDSIYFNPELWHAQKAVTSVARFLTVINE